MGEHSTKDYSENRLFDLFVCLLCQKSDIVAKIRYTWKLCVFLQKIANICNHDFRSQQISAMVFILTVEHDP